MATAYSSAEGGNVETTDHFRSFVMQQDSFEQEMRLEGASGTDSHNFQGDPDSVHDDSGKEDGTSNEDDHSVDDRSVIARKETRTLNGIKLIVAAVLLSITTALATGIYFHTSRTEEQQFQEQFNEYANKVLEDIGDTLEDTLEALDLLAVDVASAARSEARSAAREAAAAAGTLNDGSPLEVKSPWPTVTVPDFGLHAAKALSLSKIKVLVMCVVVEAETRAAWEDYTDIMGREWVDETLGVLESDPNFYGPIYRDYEVNRNIHLHGQQTMPDDAEVMLTSWQAYPIVPKWPPYNFDYLGLQNTNAHRRMLELGKITVTEPYMLPDPNKPDEVAQANIWASFFVDRIPPFEEALEPASEIYFPVFDSVGAIQADLSLKPVAGFAASFYWRDMFRDIIPKGANDMVIVTSNPCAPSFTYRLAGPTAVYIGRGDHHDPQFDDMVLSSKIYELNSFRIQNSTYSGPKVDDGYCPNTFHVYPTENLQSRYETNDPITFTIAAVMICLMTSVVFLVYDCFVERRQKVVLDTAEKSNAVVSSLFPADVRDQLYNESGATGNPEKKPRNAMNKDQKGAFGNHQDCELYDDDDDLATIVTAFKGKPIASLYESTTVMFADVVGFTSWSANREPAKVFILLETLYGAFDRIAKKRGVFKVETIGDCYVAVCGLPTPNRHHAAVMSRFACDCRSKMHLLTQHLSASLGPETAELNMRFGLNSGATTAGVLRGLKSRFQLFGDTVNTAARMESTGMVGRIQVSQATADALIHDGKLSWVASRDDIVEAKGKGRVQTYWVEPTRQNSDSKTSKSISASVSDQSSVGSKTGADMNPIRIQPQQDEEKAAKLERLVGWNSETLQEIAKQVSSFNARLSPPEARPNQAALDAKSSVFVESGPRSQLREAVAFQKLFSQTQGQLKHGVDSKKSAQLPPAIRSQLNVLVLDIALLHKSDNPFHNFEHATHVAMGSRKLLLKILHGQDIPRRSNHESSGKDNRNIKAEQALAWASDPLVQFALFFSALVHDVDHPGTPNHVLVAEGSEMAQAFANKSVAEQNSITVGWNILMSEKFDELRRFLFTTNHQIQLFQQILVHAVMATDIFDKELQQFRDERWGRIFSCSSSSSQGNTSNDDDLRMTITMEHLLQMSDLSHTMQHFTIYEKWNRSLFQEMRKTYRAGRTDQDPAEGWYRGELWFFDNFVIPLAQKSKTSGIFGNVSDEALGYAKNNRLEWEKRGKDIVHRWLEDDANK